MIVSNGKYKAGVKLYPHFETVLNGKRTEFLNLSNSGFRLLSGSCLSKEFQKDPVICRHVL